MPTVTMSLSFHRLATGEWIGHRAVDRNPDWEVEIDGDEAGPDEILRALVPTELSAANALVALGVAPLAHFTRFRTEAWYPLGAWFSFAGDEPGRREKVVLSFELEDDVEDDVYGSWTVELVRTFERWCVRSFSRTQQ